MRNHLINIIIIILKKPRVKSFQRNLNKQKNLMWLNCENILSKLKMCFIHEEQINLKKNTNLN